MVRSKATVTGNRPRRLPADISRGGGGNTINAAVGQASTPLYGGVVGNYAPQRVLRGGYGGAKITQQPFFVDDRAFFYPYAPGRVASSYYRYFPGNIRPRTNVALNRYAVYGDGRWGSFSGLPRFAAERGGRRFRGGWKRGIGQQALPTTDDGQVQNFKGRRFAERQRFFNRRQQQAASQGSAAAPSRGQRRRDSRRGGRRGKQGRVVNEDALNAELDAYMGSDVAKSRLDNQLDAYFGRNGGPVLDKSGNVADPLHDPTDITMDGGHSSVALSHANVKSLSNGVASV